MILIFVGARLRAGQTMKVSAQSESQPQTPGNRLGAVRILNVIKMRQGYN